MSEIREENSYKNILRRLSAFGGVQVFNILIALIRGKFVALFLGPSGMGIASLYTSSTGTLQQFSSLGLNLAVVKEIAADKNDKSKLRRVLAVSLRLILVTSLLGAILSILGAPLLSKITFGDYSHYTDYILLSLFLALSIAGAGFLAVLQGLGEVKRLAKASLVGGLAGLCFGVPLYYFFGDKGIVPAMIILALSTFLFYYINYLRSPDSLRHLPQEEISRDFRKSLIKKLISLGAILLIGSLCGQVIGYAINIFIRATGSMNDVGLFQGANSITNQYVGLLISALALDYFPRLSAAAQNRDQMKMVVNRQIEIVMLVSTPLIILLIITSPLIIRLLLTDSFLVITDLMRWMGIGMLIQLLAFPIGYIYIATEDKKTYLWMECIWSNICWLAASLICYHIFGLVGLGISLVARSIIDIILNLIVCKIRYGLTIHSDVARIVAISVSLSLAVFLASFLKDTYAYPAMTFLLIISIAVSFHLLRGKLKKSNQ